MRNHNQIASFIWGTANLIRDSFKRGKYQDVILSFTVLRRIDSVLEPTKEDVLEAYHQYKDELDNLGPLLRRKSRYAFYNTSNYTFDRLLEEDPGQLASNLRTYIAGFSDNIREVIEALDFRNTIDKLVQEGLLYQVMERSRNVDLHPDIVSNEQMGLVFEELIRKFNEALDENPGEHFTPREVVRLMTELVLAGNRGELDRAGQVFTGYDPCCGTGGMLTDARDRIESDTDLRDYENVPLNEDVFEYFEREVKPHVEDAFIDGDYTDEKDGQVGRVGYEIHFNRYFYEYDPPRSLDEIEADIRATESDIVEILQEVAA